MSHAGPPPLSEDDCPNPSGIGQERCSVDLSCPPTRHVKIPFDSAAEPIQAARADAAIVRDSLPFVVHSGRVLYMVAEEDSTWVVAELVFDAGTCTFVETRRTEFQWPREAFGRLMSRTLIGQELDPDATDRMSEAFTRWLASQFVA